MDDVAVLQRWKPWLIGGAVLIITALLVHTLRGLLHAFSYGDLLDAIRMHDSPGSEARNVVQSFQALTPDQKQDVLNFLRSL